MKNAKKVLLVVAMFGVTVLVPAFGSQVSAATKTNNGNDHNDRNNGNDHNKHKKTTPPPISWGVPRIVDPIHAYGEPDIKVAPNGDVLVSGPQGTGVQRSVWNVSKDNGDSWRVVNAVPSSNTQPA